jgi:hypothetical protein
LLLQLDALEKLAARPEAKQPIAAHERRTAPRRTAPAEAFAQRPIKETIELVPETVKAGPELYEKIRAEEIFEVDLVPQLVKRRIVRWKYRHRLERARAPLVAPAPARPDLSGLLPSKWSPPSTASTTSNL